MVRALALKAAAADNDVTSSTLLIPAETTKSPMKASPPNCITVPCRSEKSALAEVRNPTELSAVKGRKTAPAERAVGSAGDASLKLFILPAFLRAAPIESLPCMREAAIPASKATPELA